MTTATRPPIRQAELLGALAFASDLAFGVEVEAGARSCLVAVRIAERMGLSREDRAAVYYTALLKDAGCTAMTGTLAEFWKTDEITARRELILGDLRSPSFLARWMWQHVGAELPFASRVGRLATVVAQSRGFFAEGFSNTCEVATAIAARLGMSETVQQALLNVFEEWDGKGFPKGLKGEEIPLVARVVLPSFYFGCLCGIGGLQAATTLARDGRGSLFDPAVVDAFLALASEEGFRRELSEPGLPARVAALEPQAAVEMDAAGLDTWFEVFADFGDLKVPRTAAHSRRVAALAEGMARRLGCGPEDTDDIRRAAFAHDIGLVSVPTYALQKAATDQSAIEREQFRLHPYTAGRVLSQVPALAHIVTLIQAHHERFDGTGFYQGLKGAQIPLGSRIIGVADVFDDLTQDGPDAPALDTETALRRMREQRGTAHCPDSLDALEAELAGAAPAPARAQRPGGLTEREVEILRLAAHGATRGEIARELVVSEHTVRHHLSHIYEKLGVTTRVGATLWAMEHGLFSQPQR